jgi:hypothetical protein
MGMYAHTPLEPVHEIVGYFANDILEITVLLLQKPEMGVTCLTLRLQMRCPGSHVKVFMNIFRRLALGSVFLVVSVLALPHVFDERFCVLFGYLAVANLMITALRCRNLSHAQLFPSVSPFP